MQKSTLNPNRSSRSTVLGMVLLGWLLFIGLGGDVMALGPAEQEFAAARQLVFQGNFAAASPRLERFLSQNPNHTLASRATFLLAKSKLGSGDMAAARLWFGRTIERFPKSEEASKAQFKMATIEIIQGNNGAARERLQDLVRAANGPYTPEAAAWLRFLEAQAAKADAAEPAKR